MPSEREDFGGDGASCSVSSPVCHPVPLEKQLLLQPQGGLEAVTGGPKRGPGPSKRWAQTPGSRDRGGVPYPSNPAHLPCDKPMSFPRNSWLGLKQPARNKELGREDGGDRILSHGKSLALSLRAVMPLLLLPR